jgi:HK97 family phage prohead protease
MSETTILEKRLSSASPNSTYPAEGYDYFWKPPAWTILDPQERIVEGYASLPNLDDQGDVIPLDVIEAALPAFMNPWGNLREMHQQSAVGKVLAAKVDEHGLKIITKIEDPTAWAKVKSGVYMGFSIGGNIPDDATETRADGARLIKEVQLSEISLVDRPANPRARIGVVKLNKVFTGKTHRMKCEKHKKEGCEECGCDRTVGHPNTGASSGMAERPAQAAQTKETCSESEAQRRWAFGVQGKQWAREHHFDNPGHLPARKSATSSFAYTDSSGKGHLPIGDAAHVRNALARFNQTHFESKEKANAAWAKIKAAAKRFGIKSEADKPKSQIKEPSSGYSKTNKGIDMTTLEKVKETLVDPDDIKTLEAAEAIIAKASGSEWHTQRDVGNPKDEADEGVDLMDNDAGEDEPVDEFLKAKEADGESAGESGGKQENEQISKEDGMSHLNACHKSLQACHKAFGEEDHPGKAHCEAAMGHLQTAKKCFGKASKAAESDNLRKSFGMQDVPTREEFEELCGSVQYLVNVQKALSDKINGLPRSRPLPPVTIDRDEESRAAYLGRSN